MREREERQGHEKDRKNKKKKQVPPKTQKSYKFYNLWTVRSQSWDLRSHCSSMPNIMAFKTAFKTPYESDFLEFDVSNAKYTHLMGMFLWP